METDKLIDALTQDVAKPGLPMNQVWTAAAVVAVLIAAAAFFWTIGLRTDIAAAAGTLPFLFKFVVTIALFGSGLAAAIAFARPDGTGRSEVPMLFLAPILLGVAVVLQLTQVSGEEAKTLLVGTNWRVCLVSIPLIGIGPLVAFLLTLRHGAPTRPTLAGAIAGLAAGGLAATFYAAHCTDDSPLFVAVWYTIGVAALALVGGLAGRFLIRW